MIFNTDTKLKYLLQNEEPKKILMETVPGLLKMAEGNPQALTLSLAQLISYARIPGGDQVLAKIAEALKTIGDNGKLITEEEKKQMEQFSKIWEEELKKEKKEDCHKQEAICPGQPWLDSKGERIQAHGGAMYYEDGTYYWYGENKEYTDGQNGIWTWGFRIYASKDLYNWEDLGYLIPPELDDPDSSMFPTKRSDRPHIVKCDKTGKYVCWFKLSGPEAAFSVYQSDTLTGKYEKVVNLCNPFGHKVGDFDLIKDEKTGNAYIWFDADHRSTLCIRLSEDYLAAESVVSESYKGLIPPFTREAQSLFEYKGRKYMLTSSMSGYVPNQSDCAVAENWEDEFKSIGDPHVDDDTKASFNSQISKVFKVEGTDLYIAMADRWLSDYHVDARIADIFVRAIASAYDPEHYQASDAEKAEMYAANKLETARTQIADYVWLPLEIDHENCSVKIRWYDSWKIEDLKG